MTKAWPFPPSWRLPASLAERLIFGYMRQIRLQPANDHRGCSTGSFAWFFLQVVFTAALSHKAPGTTWDGLTLTAIQATVLLFHHLHTSLQCDPPLVQLHRFFFWRTAILP